MAQYLAGDKGIEDSGVVFVHRLKYYILH